MPEAVASEVSQLAMHTSASTHTVSATRRNVALDVMRGLTVALMILVNTPGSWSHVYPALLHADWHGCTPTDLVFPFFLFIVGAAMAFSFPPQARFSSSAALRVLRRAALIFAIGLFLNAYPFTGDLEALRIMGVLQRIAICYALAGLLVLLLRERGLLLASGVLLLGYWVLLVMNGAHAYSLEHSLVRSLDLVVLGADHMWQGKGLAFEPEGLLSTLPALVNVLIGYLLTRFWRQRAQQPAVAGKLLLIGLALLLSGWLWSWWMPLNKSLWTSSYVLFTSGIAVLLWLLIDQLQRVSWPRSAQLRALIAAPWLALGMNPLFVYVLSWLWVASYELITVGEQTLSAWLYTQLATKMSALNASLAYALLHVLLFTAVALWLRRRRIVIKL